MIMQIAVLALQGAFIEHERILAKLGFSAVELRQKSDLQKQYALYLKAQSFYASFCQEKRAGNTLLKKQPVFI